MYYVVAAVIQLMTRFSSATGREGCIGGDGWHEGGGRCLAYLSAWLLFCGALPVVLDSLGCSLVVLKSSLSL